MSKPALLFLAHRIPYPPNKGDKIRSYHLLKFLAEHFEIHLGCFVDDPEDRAHIDTLNGICASVYAPSLHPRWARLRSLGTLLSRQALSVAYYRHAGMRRWVAELVRLQRPSTVFVFSSAMGRFVPDRFDGRVLVDFVDVDALKWREYGARHQGPLRYLYRREWRALLRYDRQLARRADHALFVSEPEAALFRELVPESATKTTAVPNGVDLLFFDPALEWPSPYDGAPKVVVFTGAMDYLPNIEAVQWFAQRVWPAVLARHPGAQFCIVGANPSPAVQALAQQASIKVIGRVNDVRPFLQHASAAVAPMRIARGIQNKVLEALALDVPCIASAQALCGLEPLHGYVHQARDSAEWISTLNALLAGQPELQSRASSAAVAEHFSWHHAHDVLEPLL